MSEIPHDLTSLDPHRQYPSGALDDLSGDQQDQAGQANIEGVPLAYAQQAHWLIEGWRQRLLQGDKSAELIEEIDETMRDCEAAYPGAMAWDDCRGQLAEAFGEAGRHGKAFSMLTDILTPHYLFKAYKVLIVQQGAQAYIREFMRQLETDEGRITQRALLRGAIDFIIEHDPGQDIADDLEHRLADLDPQFDPLDSWIASQRLIAPNADWETARKLITDDPIWGSVPCRFRQHVVIQTHTMHDELDRDAGQDTVEAYVAEWTELEEQFPDTAVWNNCRSRLAALLMLRERLESVVTVGQSMTDPRLQTALAAELLDTAAEPQALEIVRSIPNMFARAKALVELPWRGAGADNAGFRELTKLIDDEDGEFTIQDRLDSMKLVRLYSIQANLYESADYWEQRMRALRAQTRGES